MVSLLFITAFFYYSFRSFFFCVFSHVYWHLKKSPFFSISQDYHAFCLHLKLCSSKFWELFLSSLSILHTVIYCLRCWFWFIYNILNFLDIFCVSHLSFNFFFCLLVFVFSQDTLILIYRTDYFLSFENPNQKTSRFLLSLGVAHLPRKVLSWILPLSRFLVVQMCLFLRWIHYVLFYFAIQLSEIITLWTSVCLGKCNISLFNEKKNTPPLSALFFFKSKTVNEINIIKFFSRKTLSLMASFRALNR